jgi:hypothetical protein
MLFQNKKETAFRKIGGFFMSYCEERSNLILGAISSYSLYLFGAFEFLSHQKRMPLLSGLRLISKDYFLRSAKKRFISSEASSANIPETTSVLGCNCVPIAVNPRCSSLAPYTILEI